MNDISLLSDEDDLFEPVDTKDDQNHHNSTNLKMEDFLKDVETNIVVPLKSSNTPYTDALNLLMKFSVANVIKIMKVLPRDVIVLNPEIENEAESKTLALQVFVKVREISFSDFDEIFFLSKTDFKLLCDIYFNVFDNLSSKVFPVQQFLHSWTTICGNEVYLTQHFMTKILLKYDFGPSALRKYITLPHDLYLDFLKKIDNYFKDPKILLDKYPELKLSRQIVQKKCRKIITNYYGGKRVDKYLTPNFYMNTSTSIVFYYLNLRRKKQIGELAFFEMLRLIASHDEDVQKEILRLLKNPRDRKSMLDVPNREFLPNNWVLNLGNGRHENSEKTYYMGKNNRSLMIIKVNNLYSLNDMINSLLYAESKIFGFDAEWLPINESQTIDIALFQISTPKVSYLIDTLTLSNAIDRVRPLFNDLFYKIFSNSENILLGFSYNEDIKRLAKLFGITFFQNPRIIDLNKINKSLRRYLKDEDIRSNSNDINILKSRCDTLSLRKHISGLSSMVYLLFGKELDKREQMSNWEQRPLRREQEIYASLDAYCLVDIYNRLSYLSRHFGFHDVSQFINYLDTYQSTFNNSLDE